MTTPFKHKASGIYWIRKAIPSTLQSKLGKTEFKESLKTRDPIEAKQLGIAKLAYWEELIRTQTESTNLTRKDVEILAQRWFEQAINKLELEDNFEDHLLFFSHKGDTCVEPMDSYLIDALESGYKDQIRYAGNEADALLQEQGIAIQKDSKSYQALVYAVCLKRLKLTQIALKRFHGDWTPDEKQDLILSKQHLSFNTQPPATKTITTNFKPLGEAVDLYIKHKQSQEAWSERRSAEVISGLKQFLTVFDPKSNPNDITREQFRDYLNLLTRTPKGLGSLKAYKGLSLREAVEKGEENSAETINPQTANNKFGYVSSLFSYLELEELVDKDRTKDLNVIVRDEDKSKRLPFTTSDLNKIFEHTREAERTVDYWVPRIGLLTGMRANEILQLHSSDIGYTDQGVPYISINKEISETTGKKKKAKTGSSLRLVPIPSVLESLGFIDFASKQKGHLFPNLSYRADGDFSVANSGTFNQMLIDLGIKPDANSGTKKDFQSFRHTFRANTRAFGISREDATLIGGWSSSNTNSGDRYGMEYSQFIERLKHLIDLIQYDGVAF